MAAPGWYGKLPGCGDFVSRRLEPGWIARWDAWLAQGLLAQRQQAPDAWLARYLAMPTWRFALAPGALAGDHAWRVGVLMPSVDRVGRYFPLTVVSVPLPGFAPAHDQVLAGWEAAAQAALQHDWPVAQFDTALLAAAGNAAAAEVTHREIEHGESRWWRAGEAPHTATGLPRLHELICPWSERA